MFRRTWRVILVAAVLLIAAWGSWNDTSTGIDLDKLPQFPLLRIRSGWLKAGSRITFDGISVTAATGGPQEVRLGGAGNSGKRWEADVCCLDEVWRADLDGNGTQDYVLFGPGPYYNGRTTPTFSMSILLMDREGVPVPFFTVVHDGKNGAGIKQLVDLNHDGHAELLISSYDEVPSDARVVAFASGHWVTQLYRFKNFGAEEVRGTVGGIPFPFVHDWTYWGTQFAQEAESPSPVRPAVLYEHGTSSQGEVVTRIRKWSDSGSLLEIDPVAGCKAIRTSLVVYDRPGIREIGFPNLFSSYSADLVDRMRRDGAHLQLRGIDRWMGNGDCSVNLIWATAAGRQ